MTKLKGRGISGAAALKCCEDQRDFTKLRIREFLGNLLRRVLEAEESDRDDLVLAFVPPRGPQVFPPRPIKTILAPKGSPLLIGAIVLLAGLALGSIIAKIATYTVLSSLIDHIDFLLPDDCNRCVRKHLWSQSKSRVPGIFFAKKFRLTKNPRKKDYRRFPFATHKK